MLCCLNNPDFLKKLSFASNQISNQHGPNQRCLNQHC